MDGQLEQKEGKDNKAFLTLDELADLLRVTPQTMSRLARRGDLPIKHYRIGRQWRFYKADVDEWLGISALLDEKGK